MSSLQDFNHFLKNRHLRIYHQFEDEINQLARGYSNREQFLRNLFPEPQFRIYKKQDNKNLYEQFIHQKPRINYTPKAMDPVERDQQFRQLQDKIFQEIINAIINYKITLKYPPKDDDLFKDLEYLNLPPEYIKKAKKDYQQTRILNFLGDYQPPPEIQLEKLDDFVSKPGYKSKDKTQHLIKQNYGQFYAKEWLKDSIPNYFPLKENKKKYNLHIIGPKDSFMMDVMFDNGYVYLVAININTRKLWVEPTYLDGVNQLKSAQNIMNALGRMIIRGMEPKYIKGDGEKAFISSLMSSFYDLHGITFIPVPTQITKYPEFMRNTNMVQSIKKESKHTSLALIDRVIRTIRDMAYNLEYDKITPERMRYIEFLYNNAPHSTLSKYAGQPVSPNDVDNDEELEMFIVRRIEQENFNTASQFNFDLIPNQKVVVYNERNPLVKRRSQIEPGNHRIVGRKGNQFIVEDEFGNQELKTRVKINPI